MADDNNNEKQEKQPEDDTPTSNINPLRGPNSLEDAITAHVHLLHNAQYYEESQHSESSNAQSPRIVPQQPSEKQSSDEDSPRAKK